MAIISVRVDDKGKKVLEKAGININKELKNLIDSSAWNVELSERLKVHEKVEIVPGATKGFSSKSVREDRETH